MTLGHIKWKIVIIKRDSPRPWFPEQKERFTALHPDMIETVVRKRILRKFGADLENSIRRRFIAPFFGEDYINAMEDITTRRNSIKWYKPPIDNKTSWKQISRERLNTTEDRDP
ncbi:hypothetical protein O181_031120 [Austropuccinia psidii MF-1]|uniref:Uncharacterized protein n=1 Tax=Austropuccinia psidii MF-1 TaxID=1389203 RepID=A0A9Q3CYF4_9BASI|nr:hypothetical protein [Austropuccinia psidii MF-1]